jgi:hypothetical protein
MFAQEHVNGKALLELKTLDLIRLGLQVCHFPEIIDYNLRFRIPLSKKSCCTPSINSNW